MILQALSIIRFFDFNHCGMQNYAPPPDQPCLKDVHILIPGTCEYIMLHDKGGIKAANKLP